LQINSFINIIMLAYTNIDPAEWEKAQAFSNRPMTTTTTMCSNLQTQATCPHSEHVQFGQSQPINQPMTSSNSTQAAHVSTHAAHMLNRL